MHIAQRVRKFKSKSQDQTINALVLAEKIYILISAAQTTKACSLQGKHHLTLNWALQTLNLKMLQKDIIRQFFFQIYFGKAPIYAENITLHFRE